MKWWIGGFFTLLIVLFTLVVWWEQKSSGACYEQHAPHNTENPTLPVTQEEKSPQQANGSSPNSESYFCRLIVPANLPTDYLVIIGIGGVWAALLTLGAIQRQADLMEKALKVVEAADIAIESASLVPVGAITSDSHIAIQLKNFGRTRADNIRSHIVTIIPGTPNSEPSADTFSLAAGGTQLVGFLKFREFLNQETFNKIQSGIISVRFSGNVTYDDRFGDSHILECKGTLHPQTGTFILGDSDPRNQNQNTN